MSNLAVLRAAFTALEKLVTEYLEAIDGIPEDDLNSWKPSAEQQGGGDMNTLAAMSIHTATAASWMIQHQVFGRDFHREREQEFQATATRAEIDTLFGNLVHGFEVLIDADPDIDLNAMPPTIRETIPNWNRMMWLFHAIDHTALHLGHAQITRQLWLAERANTP